MNPNVDTQALAQAVTQRRATLGIDTQRELAEKADLSPRMVGEIENARRDSYRDSTLFKIDRALNWKLGSSQGVLNGLPPYPLEDHVDTDEAVEEGFDDEDIEGVSAGTNDYDISVSEDRLTFTIYIDRRVGDRDDFTVTALLDVAEEAFEFVSDRIEQSRSQPSELAGMSDKERLEWAHKIIEKFAPLQRRDTEPTPTSAPTEQEKSAAASAATPDPAVAYDDVAQAKLAEVLQSDYTPAASPHAQLDPHNGVGEENQDE
ncbi:XRE family transcriptional regulator [Flaviflexus ciconiae]|uniref:XRE family transcriptional regulator n=1 Tax=Flaviflexus ciconiae TaxID=2496867 RepID=A0A3Q9G2S2_9ACTO|nr:helix-turn-helix transcriptional regulator [Flaviflexus ciconiae]AZQ77637.1 XRE family transcriptional regulator [Flaviflexus ciconiae]